ncbi:MAG: hypothetical protein GY861_17540 [bacterium]|nr:hypothetical protein [bacterium]
MLDANDKIVKGNEQNGIAYNGEQYFAIVNGDKIGTFGNDQEFAEKVFKEKTGRDV